MAITIKIHKLIALPFLDHGIRRGREVSVTPRPLFTAGKTRYPLYRRLGGPQCRSGQVRKISPPPGFDPRTFQPVASRWLALKSKLIVRTALYTNYVREQSLRVWDNFCVMLSEDLHAYLQHTRMESYCLQRSNGHNFRILTCSAFLIILPSH
jgi:hypothetical protein